MKRLHGLSLKLSLQAIVRFVEQNFHLDLQKMTFQNWVLRYQMKRLVTYVWLPYMLAHQIKIKSKLKKQIGSKTHPSGTPEVAVNPSKLRCSLQPFGTLFQDSSSTSREHRNQNQYNLL